jgi:hypothetical protein
MDHGGDIAFLSLANKTAVLLFFAGELSVRHHDTSSVAHPKSLHHQHTHGSLEHELDTANRKHKSAHSSHQSRHSSNAGTSASLIDIAKVAGNAIGFLTRKESKTLCGIGIGNVMTVMSGTPASGGYTHFGECIDQAHQALQHCTDVHTNVCQQEGEHHTIGWNYSSNFTLTPLSPALTIMSQTNLISDNTTTIHSTPTYLSFSIEDVGTAKYINPGLTVTLPFVRRFLTPNQLDLVVANISDFVCAPLAALAHTGKSLNRISTASAPTQATCAIIRSRLCPESNSTFFGKDSNAHDLVQSSLDDITSSLPTNDYYIADCEVSNGEVRGPKAGELRSSATERFALLCASASLSELSSRSRLAQLSASVEDTPCCAQPPASAEGYASLFSLSGRSKLAQLSAFAEDTTCLRAAPASAEMIRLLALASLTPPHFARAPYTNYFPRRC